METPSFNPAKVKSEAEVLATMRGLSRKWDEPDAGETALLGYRRGDVAAAVAEIVAQYG